MAIEEATSDFESQFEALNFSRALESLWALVASLDVFLTTTAPWKQPEGVSDESQEKLRRSVLYTAAEAIRILTALVYPVMPWAAGQVWAQLGLGDIESAASSGQLKNLQWGGLQPGTKLGTLGPIFPRAEKDTVTRMQEIEQNNTPAQPTSEPEQPQAQSATPKPEAAQPKAEAAPAAASQAPAAPAAPEKAAPAKPSAPAAKAPATLPVPEQHHSRLRAAIQALAVAMAEATSESSLIAAFEQAIGLTVEESISGKPRTAAVPAAASAAAPAPISDKISIDDFIKVELRVGQIKVAERIPKADKLLRLEIDLGTETRQILAGIAESYEPESLIGRKIVIVANLAPRKMRGLESNGMLLAATNEEGKAILCTFAEDVQPGARLK